MHDRSVTHTQMGPCPATDRHEQPPASHSGKQTTGLGVGQGEPGSVNSVQITGSAASFGPVAESSPITWASSPPSSDSFELEHAVGGATRPETPPAPGATKEKTR